ncbi:hypothetical protein HYW21_08175 [Candidatus Woesearchaeota archaeon]|nr:hypothetical protein [Candidatus Woesearchaeota archaeon]
MNNLQRILTTIGISTISSFGITQGNPRHANAETRVECMGGNATTTLDLKLVEEPWGNTLFIPRERTTIGYGTNGSPTSVDHFTSFLGGYQCIKGWYLDAEVQFTSEEGVVPKLGIEHSHQFGKKALLDILTTGSIRHDPVLEITVHISYEPPEGKRGMMATVEAVTNWENSGHNFNIQRLRFGREQRQYQAGIAADVLQDNNASVSYSVGLFIAKSF